MRGFHVLWVVVSVVEYMFPHVCVVEYTCVFILCVEHTATVHYELIT